MKIYLFSATHWDREWYQPFQAFRMRLIGMMDRMIETLETDKDFGVFHMDGQTVVLEDYLEIKPEKKGRIEALIKSGKLVVGPWYVMPDELLLSGESYIKNLKKGFSISRDFGAEPMKFGYLCDMFGHCAQMPQILKEMGIDNALVGRGANNHTTPMHFVWDAPSGDSVVTFKLEDTAGYGVLHLRGARPLLGDDYATQLKVERPLLGRDADPEKVKANLKKYIDTEFERANAPAILLMDGDDHQDCRSDTTAYMNMLREMYPDAEIIHTQVEDFCEYINSFKDELPHREGELIEPTKIITDYSNLLTNCLSSRYPIKKKNDYMQTRLEKIIEPLYALDKIDEPYKYIDIANTYLLKNHAHDTICGCSIDVVHRDMMTRFEQSEAICDQLFNEYWESRRKDEETDNIAFEILNILPYNDKRTVETEIWFPENWKTKYGEYFGYEERHSFKINDEEGNEIPYGISAVKKNSTRRYHNIKFGVFDVYTVSFEAELKAMKANRFIVKPCEEYQRYMDTMTADETSAENEYISISFDARGLMTLKDKVNNQTYTGLLETVDDCEIGDGWNHGDTLNDYKVTNTLHSLVLKEKSYSRTVFEVTQKLCVPDRILNTKHGFLRDDHKSDLYVIHTIILGRNEKWVEVKTKVINNVKDHRLRIKFPTGLETENYFVNQPFCFVERKHGIDISTQNWKEKSIQEKQTAGIVCVKNENAGIGFISDFGIHECAVTEKNDIYITLMRCFSRVHLHDGMPEGQIQGEHEYRYLLMPVSSGTPLAELQRRQDFLQTDGLNANIMATEDAKENSLIKVLGENIVYSTLTKGENFNEIRVYNASDSTDTAKIEFAENIKKVELVNLDGKKIEELAVNNNSVMFQIGKWKIATIRYIM